MEASEGRRLDRMWLEILLGARGLSNPVSVPLDHDLPGGWGAATISNSWGTLVWGVDSALARVWPSSGKLSRLW